MSENSSAVADFAETASRYCSKLGSERAQVVPFHSEHLGVFQAMSPAHQAARLEPLKKSLQVVEDAIRSNVDLNDTRWLFRDFAELQGLHPIEFLQSCLGSGDTIELLDSDHAQIFRNLVFFERGNYTLADHVLYRPHDLYGCSSYLKSMITNSWNKLFSGQESVIYAKDTIPPYTRRELKTAQQASYLVNDKYYIRLVDAAKRPYVLVVKSVIRMDWQS